MTERGRNERLLLGVALVLAVAVPLANHLAFGDEGLSMRDEGYLWYGLRAVLGGEVPLRDFQAYDPGRYYVCAALAPLLGDGVLGVRASSAVFGALGLFAALCVARRALSGGPGARSVALTVLALVLMAWSFPRHKRFEPAIASIGVLVATRLVEHPSLRRHLVAGVTIGLGAWFGRNHGLYLGLGLGGLALWLARTEVRSEGLRRAGTLAGGAILGALPLLGMFVLVPGFLAGYVHATRLLLAQGANLPVPWPWPWRLTLAGPEGFDAGALGVALAFLLPPLVLAAGAVVLLRRRAEAGRGEDSEAAGARAALAGSLAIALPYVHHYAVRSDLSHLAQGIHPVLLAALAVGVLGMGARRLALALPLGVLVLVSALVVLERHPAAQRLTAEEPEERVRLEVGGDDLILPFPLARHLHFLGRMFEQTIRGDEVLIAPTNPTLYPIFGKRSPDWWIYYLWPAPEEEQRATIERIEARGVRWALISKHDFEGDASYGFAETNPLVWAHLEEEFELVVDEDVFVPRQYDLFRRRPADGR